MNRKLSILLSRMASYVLISIHGLFLSPAAAQQEVNVITFLQAVASVCGGSTGQEITSTGDNTSFRSAEVTVDPGTGTLTVKNNGVLIAELDGDESQGYYNCVQNLTEALGGVFVSPTGVAPDLGVAYPEPTRDEMRQAHLDQVEFAALFVPIDHFEKLGCQPSRRAGYDCTYSIRAGGFGSPRQVTNSFVLIDGQWVMYFIQ